MTAAKVSILIEDFAEESLHIGPSIVFLNSRQLLDNRVELLSVGIAAKANFIRWWTTGSLWIPLINLLVSIQDCGVNGCRKHQVDLPENLQNVIYKQVKNRASKLLFLLFL